MNKYCYRVIFNKSLNRFEAVSELAKSAGKSSAENRNTTKIFEKPTALWAVVGDGVLKPLSFALFCAWGFVSISLPVQAEMMIKADKTAVANQRPVVLETANGIPQVNIQTPNNKGLSHNKYQQFDVDSKGAILNNSRKTTATQLGGHVQGNPYLAGGEAKVILNEVNSNKPSQLRGYVEVAGKKADVIIANSNGVHCEGCGIINADRATITTGKPQIKEGNLDGFVVEKGKVTVSGKGMDNAQSDYTDIIARSAEINAGIWSKKAVKVTTGNNRVSKNNDSVQILHSKTQSNANANSDEKFSQNPPRFALDVSELGGMYADKIYLIGTEQGLGVRNAGHIGAAAGEVVIDADGKIVNTGNIQASQNVRLKADGEVHNASQSKIIAQRGNIEVTTKSGVKQSGKMVAGDKISLKSTALEQTAKGEIQGKQVRIEATELISRGLIEGEKTFLKSTALSNLGTGRIYGNHVAIQSTSVLNDKEGEKSGTIAARERLDVGVGTLTNRDHALIFSAGQMSFGGKLDKNQHATGKATFIDNASATIEALGNGEMNTQRLWNHDLHLVLGEEHSDEHREEYTQKHLSERYVLEDKTGKHGWFERKNNDKHDSQSYLHLNDQKAIGSNGWMHWVYNRHTVTTTIVSRDPAQLLMGGDFKLSGEELENNASRLSIGGKLLLGETTFTKNETNGDLTAGNTTLRNIDIPGTINVTDTGRWDSFKKQRHRHGTHKKVWANYETGRGNLYDIHPTIPFFFNKVSNEIGQPVVSANASIALPPSAGQGNANIRPPQSSLYQVNPDALNGYIVETDPAFTDRKQWLSSDYMFNALHTDHNHVLKRLGDGFYEQRLINEQINQLTGRRFLGEYQTDYEQYKALMDSGIHFAKQFNLVPGVALTDAQMNELTSDIVWFVSQEITLQNGQKTTALVPQVYLAPRNIKLVEQNGQGAVISAREIVGKVDNLQNQGLIAGRDLTHLSTNHLVNQGVIAGSVVNLLAEQTLQNVGGKIQAQDSATLVGKGGVEIRSSTSHKAHKDTNGNEFDRTVVAQVSEIAVADKTGKLTLYSPQDVVIKGAKINSAGTAVIQGNNIEIGTLETKNKTHYNADANNYYRLDQQQEVGSQINAQGDIQLLSQQDMRIRQGNLHSETGEVTLTSAKGNIRIEEGRSKEQLSSASKSTHRGLLQSSTRLVKHDHHYDLAEGSNLDGKNVVLQAQNGNIQIQGSNVVADEKLTAQAKNIEIREAENRILEQDFESYKKSGLMGSGGLGFSLGEKKDTTENNQTKRYAKGSQVGSLQGETDVIAEQHYQQRASTLSSVKSDVNITAKNVDILSADDKYETHYKHTTEQKGLTVALTAPAIEAVKAVETVAKQANQVGESKDNRINAMAVANTGWSAYRAGQGLMQAQESLAQMVNSTNPVQAANVSVSITYGQQKNVQTTDTQGNTANSSSVNAGGKVNIKATGRGKDSDINIVGSSISGKGGTTLIADNNVNLLAAKQTHQERSKNQSSGFNAGVALNYGTNGLTLGVTAGGNYGKGYGNGDEVTWANSHIGDKNSQTTIQSGADTNLKGAQVRGSGIKLTAQNLNIESLQDTMTYNGKQMNVSGQVTVGYGASASASYNQSKINADYASVQEQSGIFAGDEGYHVDIKNHTDVKGALITSTEQSEKEGKNSFATGTLTHSDIENYANYEGMSFGLSASGSIGGGESSKDIGGVKLMSLGTNTTHKTEVRDGDSVEHSVGKLGGDISVGIGHDSESKSSITKSGINTANIHIRDIATQEKLSGKSVGDTLDSIKTDVTTELAESHSGKLERNFDKDKVLKELNLQVKVTKEFRSNAFSTINAYVEPKQAELRKQIKETQDEDKKTELYNEIYKLQYQKRLLETLVGIVSGTPGTAITQGTLQLAATKMREETLKNSRKAKPIVDAKTGFTLSNVSYDSGYFDGVKLGGVRMDENAICDAGDCVENASGTITFNAKKGKDNDWNKIQSLEDAINPFINKDERIGKMYGPTGCLQGTQGGFCRDDGKKRLAYSPGSFGDSLIESFAGTHDFIGGQMWGFYDEKGNTSAKGPLKNFAAETTTVVAIPVAAPFAMGDLISPDFVEFLINWRVH